MNHIDAKGKACPMPVMMAKKEMDTGCEALSITVDNAIAVQNLSRLAESQGFAAETAEENGCYTITMHRTGAPAQEMEGPAARARLRLSGVHPGWRLRAAAMRTKSKPRADQSSACSFLAAMALLKPLPPWPSTQSAGTRPVS